MSFRKHSVDLSSLISCSKVQVQTRSSLVSLSVPRKALCFVITSYTAAVLDHGIPALQLSYDERFQRAFPYPSDYPLEAKDGLTSFSKAVTSNLLGGVGYFYGTSIVNRKFSYEWDEEEDADTEEEAPEKGAGLTEPRSLLTATPSRSFFPRGFYWWVFLRLPLLASSYIFVAQG